MAVNENKVQLSVLKSLQKQGIFCWRQNNGATYDPKLGGYRFNYSSIKGVPDIVGLLPNGKFLGVEVKSVKGKMSPEQFIFAKRIRESNGVYILARSAADVDNIVDNLLQ